MRMLGDEAKLSGDSGKERDGNDVGGDMGVEAGDGECWNACWVSTD
jgi:hypothetical protein